MINEYTYVSTQNRIRICQKWIFSLTILFFIIYAYKKVYTNISSRNNEENCEKNWYNGSVSSKISSFNLNSKPCARIWCVKRRRNIISRTYPNKKFFI